MRFLRENLFLACTVAAVVLAAIALPLVNSSLNDTIETRKQERQRLARQIDQASGKPVNDAIIAAKRQRLLERAESQQKAASLCTLWNGRNYQPFLLDFNSAKGLRRIPVVPIDASTDKYDAMWFKFAELYRSKLHELRKGMNPVRPLDAAELDKQAAIITAQRAISDKFAPPPAAQPAVQPGANAPEAPQAREDSPQEQARKTLLKKRAMDEGNMIYFDEGAMDVVNLPDTTRPKNDQIYQAMLNYWVTSDILAAIKATNEQAAAAARARGIEKPGVVDAGVKEIVKIDISEDYTSHGSENFTLRRTCRDYTILPYKFQVIMPLSWLNTLQSKLMDRNYHTVLRIQAKALATADGKSPDKYYGTDPVMDIVVEGQLLLLADWERGNAADSTLKKSDIVQWPAFTASLVRQGLSATPSAARRVWNLLSEGMRKNLTTRPTVTQDPGVQESLVAELKQILVRKDFYALDEFKGVTLTPQQQLLADKLDEGRLGDMELHYFNRSLFNDALGETVSPPQYLPALVPVDVLAKMPQEALRQQDQDRLSNKTP
ncbi:MAG: hypothetical protein ABFD92_01835 [Planctomycetaceae bacterium]|nr:hypothetical protein [Planctomycetaceae bacterium]